MIPVFRPSVTDAEINAVTEVLRSGWWGLGPKTAEFERLFADYTCAKYAVGLNSATAALELCYLLANVDGGEVITTPMTFVSTNHMILHRGGTPVFADIEPDTLNINPSSVADLVTKHTKAIVVVHYGGHPCDMDAIHRIAASCGAVVIEDAAHACGAEYRGRKIGSISPLTSFSFHAVKNLAMGEGGAITLDREDWRERLKHLRWLGINHDTWSRSATRSGYSWEYDVEEIGFKCHLSDIAAALGIVQLHRLEETNGRRRLLAERYKELLSDLDWLELPVERADVKSAHHNFVIKVPEAARDRLIDFLRDRGIATGMHYIPSHIYKVYEAYRRSPLPVADVIWKRLITLPLFPDLTEGEQDSVVASLRDFSSRC